MSQMAVPPSLPVVVGSRVSPSETDFDRAEAGERFVRDFGPNGAVWFAEGRSYNEAQQLHRAELQSERERLLAENEHLKAMLARGEQSPVAFGGVKPSKPAQAAGKTGSEALDRVAASIQLPESPQVGSLGV